MPYTILIPVHNEASCIPKLLSELKIYYKEGHQILIVDDGSTDESKALLKSCTFINILSLEKQSGKGSALRKGLANIQEGKVIVFDGDMEINPSEIRKLMILKDEEGLRCVFGSRYTSLTPLSSFWDFGNFLFTKLFNFLNGTQYSDALCGVKAFYTSDINFNELSSKSFDIDVELGILLTRNIAKVETVFLSYKRRSSKEGKKLRIYDGLTVLRKILKRSLKMRCFFILGN